MAMTMQQGGIAGLLVLALFASSASAQRTYQLNPITNPGGYTAMGWLETDGTLGELVAGNLIAFEITIENDIGTRLTLDETNSGVETIGILATASDLSFDGSNPNAFGSEEPDINGPTGFEFDIEYGNGASMLYTQFIRVDGISDKGEQPLAGLPFPLVFAVPEPRGMALLLVGSVTLALCGACRTWSRARP